jgi:hypothetical protein
MRLNLPDSNYIDQIAALIKQDPSITVKKIAQELKFADSKSVYYWLDKSNVGGIKEFRRLVLGHESVVPGSVTLDIEGVPHFIVVLPLYDWNPKQKNPGKEWHYLHSHPHPQGLFAIRVNTSRYSPWFMPGDVLVVSKGDNYPEGSWTLSKTKGEFVIGKMIDRHIVDPMSLHAYGAGLTGVGRIIHQQRSL